MTRSFPARLGAPAALACAAVLAALAPAPAAAQPSAASPGQSALPEAVRVPAGHRVRLETVGRGEIVYECRMRSAGGFEWAFVAPEATLLDRRGGIVGRYYGGPTWEGGDGSRVGGRQVAVAPAGRGAIPLQLVRAEPMSASGAMAGISWIQRLDTRGGTAPLDACGEANTGERRKVSYQADYVLWAPDA